MELPWLPVLPVLRSLTRWNGGVDLFDGLAGVFAVPSTMTTRVLSDDLSLCQPDK